MEVPTAELHEKVGTRISINDIRFPIKYWSNWCASPRNYLAHNLEADTYKYSNMRLSSC